MGITIDHQTVLDLVEAAGDTLSVRTNYSGRGMYGSTCLGVVGSTSAFASFLVESTREAYETDDDDLKEFVDELQDPREDSMGRSGIYYWPRIQVTNLVPTKDNEDDTGDWS